MPLAPNSAALQAPFYFTGGMPPIKLDGGRKIERPSREWDLHQLRWRWLLDSWEGGEAYRMAIYGFDIHGCPIRNLIRHKREYPSSFDVTYSQSTGRPPGTDQANQATDDDYELRRARTPVPTFLAEAVDAHLAKVYSREVARTAPESSPLEGFWADVDGKGCSIDHWMAETAAPLLLVLGQLDVLIEHPPVPKGESLATRADEIRLGTGRAVASVILPENLAWWKLDAKDRYAECLVREPQDDGTVLWRYWDASRWILFTAEGKEKDRGDHGFGRVPIIRLFDRKRPRSRNVGLPRYERIAELQREYYNRDSELILSDTTQAHPLLQGPEDYVSPDGTVPIGPNWLLPKKKNNSGGGASYEGFDVIQFPKDGAASIRLNKFDIRDAVDRAACMTKPAGSAGTGGGTVGQSGISKLMDAVGGNDLLGKVAGVLQRAERQIAELALLVLADGKPAKDAMDGVKIGYPRQFDLMSADELAKAIGEFQAILASAGRAPEVEEELLCKLVRLMLPGLDDDEYAEFDAEIESVLSEAAAAHSAEAEAAFPPRSPETNAMGPETDSTEDAPAGDADDDTAPRPVDTATRDDSRSL